MNRRYDIDWIRVIAIGLLLIYHVAIGFQPWGLMIAFITNDNSWPSLWVPMMMLNVWRIPLLFFVSGMGVYFAMQSRNWKQLIMDRTWRIWLPFVFGGFAIVPIHLYLWREYYHFDGGYQFSPGHLWFLANIFAYVLLFTPLFYYLKRNDAGHLAAAVRKLFGSPLGIVVMIAVFILEAIILKPNPYEMYAMTWHGFYLGLLAFFFGFCFVFSGEKFWQMILKFRWIFLSAAAILFVSRVTYYAPVWLLVIESDFWIIAVFAFGYRYLNHPGKALSYLSKAAYPVYILHMLFLYLGSSLIFKIQMNVQVQFVLVLAFTVAGCFASYEVIRRIKWVRVLFGIPA